MSTNSGLSEFKNKICDMDIDSLLKDFIVCKKEDVFNADGRKSNSHEGAKKGSFIYFLLDNNKEILYIGETGDSLKDRLKGHGNGAHDKKSWFNQVKYIKYFKVNESEMDWKFRLVIESILVMKFQPKYNAN